METAEELDVYSFHVYLELQSPITDVQLECRAMYTHI